jgi:hypothetical protein
MYIKELLLLFLILSCASRNKIKYEDKIMALNKAASVQKIQLSDTEKSQIAKAVEGKRIVFLGEPDHWIKEKVSYQLTMIEYLQELGFAWLGNERSHIDSKCIERHLISGNKEITGCGELGYRASNWPKRSVAQGILGIKPEYSDEYKRRFIGADTFFFKYLSNLSRKYKINYFGYDIDKIPDILFDALEPYAKILNKHETLTKIGHSLQRSGDIKTELSRLQNAKTLLDEYEDLAIQKLGRDSYTELRNTLKHSLLSIDFLATTHKDPSNETLMAAYAEREKVMFEIVDKVLENPQAKLILVGHNGHLPLDHLEYRRLVDVNDSVVEIPSWLTLGSYLNNKYPDEAVAFWMLYNQGFHSAPFCKDSFPCEIKEDPRTLESTLAEMKFKGLISSSELMTKIKGPAIWRENGINRVTGDLKKVVDFIYFVPNVEPLSFKLEKSSGKPQDNPALKEVLRD